MITANYSWKNESQVKITNGIISIWASDQSDFFCNLDGRIVTDSPMYYQELAGDCIIRARVSLEQPLNHYDGVGLIIYADDQLWVKSCLEATDFGTLAAVSIVTNGVSDDANGPNVDVKSIWIQITRKDDSFAVHYSLDGMNYFLLRICKILMPDTVKAGLIAQAPLGKGGYRNFEQIVIQEITVANIRDGK